MTDTAWSGPVVGSVSQSYDADFRVATQILGGLIGGPFGFLGKAAKGAASNAAEEAVTEVGFGVLGGSFAAAFSE